VPFTTPLFPASLIAGTSANPSTDIAAGAGGVVNMSAMVITNNLTDAGFAVTPKLWLKTVFFKAKDADLAKIQMVNGFTKTIEYSVAQAYKSTQISNTLNIPIVTGVIRPTRVWVMPLVTDTLTSQGNTFPACIGPYMLSHTNIQLNGLNFYNNEFRSQYSLYKEFKTQCIAGSGSTACGVPISYDDWMNGINPYVFDLSRNPTVRSNNQCTLTLTTNVLAHDGTPLTIGAGGGAVASFDLLIIVERTQTCQLKISEGAVEVFARPGGVPDPIYIKKE
jgi:hypothetical protein